MVKTQGRHGEVAAQIYTDIPERFVAGMKLLALPREADRIRRELAVEDLWPHKGMLVFKFAGVDSMSEAETLIGCELQVPQSQRSELQAGWNYVSDLVGCAVLDGDREIGRIERTLFMLAWLEDPALRRRVTAGLNKGEARNSLARAVFFNQLGEIRDRSFENQRHRASGLNLVVAAITLWNTVYLERATEQMAKTRQFDPGLLQHISPLGWEHINLTGDYSWHTNKRVAKGGFRPLRSPRNLSSAPIAVGMHISAHPPHRSRRA